MKARKPDTKRKIDAILKAYREEGPITLRRAYYVLLSRGFFDLTKSRNPKYARNLYMRLSKLLVDLREEGAIPPAAIVDRARELIKRPAFQSFDDCFSEAVDDYAQDSMIAQARAVEVWIEKDTMRNIFLRDCYLNDVPLVISKGFTSWTFKRDAVERFAGYGKPVTILYFGDFDFEGEHIPSVLEAFVRERLPGLDFRFKKILLTRRDFGRLKEFSVDFEPDPKQLEKAYVKEFIAKHGAVKLEVEALSFAETKRRFLAALHGSLELQVVADAERLAEANKRAWMKRHYRP